MLAGHEFMYRPLGTGKGTVVVDDQYSTRCQPRVQVLQLMARGFVPVRVKAEQTDLVRQVAWDSVFDPSLHKFHPFNWVAAGFDVGGDLAEFCAAPVGTAVIAGMTGE